MARIDFRAALEAGRSSFSRIHSKVCLSYWIEACDRSGVLPQRTWTLLAIGWLASSQISGSADNIEASNPLLLPAVGNHGLRMLSPALLELRLVTTKPPDPARVNSWDFVGEQSALQLPHTNDFQVLVAGREISVRRVGFKRRVLFAPLKQRDLRIGNDLYLELAGGVSEGQAVVVKNPSGNLWTEGALKFQARMEPLRWSPAIHANQVGYVPGFPKKAMVGYYLGSLGEMKLPEEAGGGLSSFRVVDAKSGAAAFSGTLKLRPDHGFLFPCYQQVWEADFSEFRTPGRYRLVVPGLGASFPFWIDEGAAAAFARTYALGLYHQRCGAANALPFTRFTHGPCHTAPADVPTPAYQATQRLIKRMSDGAKKDLRHTAPQLESVDTALYPYVRQSKVDVSGGHHDAGDYSKYTINSAALVHCLVFAVDAFPGVGELDNLGIPESGDGKSDLLQEAKWEADFLAKMQDADGGFYFLVYPKERAYEDNVLPDKGDPQVVWPKNTSATAAAVAALAELSSSPWFKKQFPEAAQAYWEKARLGWAFLESAMAKHGRDGAYQKLSHYGHEFFHDDELAWAATEMFLATGDHAYEREVISRFHPGARETKRWSWWRLYEGYGCAIRSYAFASQSGRLKPEQLNPAYLEQCKSEILAAGMDQARSSRECAYGSSFPDPNKRFRNAGWYFSNDQAFDIVTAIQLADAKSRPELLEAVGANLNYEAGGNPVNICYLTGLGWKRPRDIVHQYSQNDRRLLPASGIPIGNIQAGFQFLHHYGKELGTLTYPSDGAKDQPYPFYDRWGDSFNVSTEFVIADQARGLAGLAFLMAQTKLKDQRWKATDKLHLTGLPKTPVVGESFTVRPDVSGLELDKATLVWETDEEQPVLGGDCRVRPRTAGTHWMELEAQWPDGRRAFAVTNWAAKLP